MVELCRTVRFCLNGSSSGETDGGAAHNTFAAWPTMQGLGRYYELHVACRGEADPVTGYSLNIKEIDKAVRGHALPYLQEVVASEAGSADAPLGRVMTRLLELIASALPLPVIELRLSLTPYLGLSIGSDDMGHVTIRNQYEFAAAHRLHVPAMSDEENRQTFGKCNNPSGHGHNYRLEVAARVPIDPDGRVLSAQALDEVVDEHVVQRLDHKHLNVDVPQFAELNPSVEHIAQVIYDLLREPIVEAGGELDEVRVWETSKTVCTYRG